MSNGLRRRPTARGGRGLALVAAGASLVTVSALLGERSPLALVVLALAWVFIGWGVWVMGFLRRRPSRP